jgi:hypothetical protein
MAAPEAVLMAAALISPVTCPDCGPIWLFYDAVRELVMIPHPEPCERALDPGGRKAVTFALYVEEKMERFVMLAQFGEPLPENVMVAT